jgi:hypothetical protein
MLLMATILGRLIYALDDQGHCLVAEATMRSILHLWQEIVAQRALQAEAGAAVA